MPNYHFYKMSLIYSALNTEVLENHQLSIFNVANWIVPSTHQPTPLELEFELLGSTVFPFLFYLFLSFKINIRYNLICFKLICHHIQTCKTCLKWGTPTFYSLPVTHDLCLSGSVSQSLVTVFHFVDKIWILSLRLTPHEWYVP